MPGQAGPARPDNGEAAELAELRVQLRRARETIEAARSGSRDLQRHRTLLEQAEVAAGLGWWIAELRTYGRITASPQMLRMLGLAEENFDSTTATLRALLPPEDEAKISAQTAQTLQDGSSFQVEHRIIRPDGAVRWLRQSAVAERDEAGAPVRMLGICQDITDQKLAEDEIRAGSGYNRSLIETSLDPMLVVDLEGRITDLNEAATQVSGYTKDEVIGTNFSQYFAEPAVTSAYEQVFRTGSLREFSLGLRHRDGHVTPLQCNAVVYRDQSGNSRGVLAFGHDVTETRRAESALRESRERLSAIFDNAPVGIVDLTPDGQIVRVNPRFCQITGYTADELRSMPVQDLIHPDDRDADLAQMRLLLAGEIDHYSMERRYVRNNGDLVWVEVNRAIVRDDDGQPKLIVGVGRDITAQREAEATIRAAAEYNQILLGATPEPLVATDPDGLITDANPAAEQATGYERSELSGEHVSAYFSDPQLASEAFERALREGAVRDVPLELRHRDGHLIPLICNAVAYRDARGDVLGVLASGFDVTAIRRTEAALRESRERLSALVDSAPIGIYDMAPSGELVRVNPRFCQITGYNADELRSMLVQSIIHSDDLDTDMGHLRRLLAGEIDSYTLEKRYQRKGGGIVWAEVNRAIVRDTDGQPLLIVAAVRDITAQLQAEAEVRALNAELGIRVEERTADLERANSNLEAFTYSVSHDLRAPLRALSGFSEALLDEYSDRLDEAGRGYAQRIQAASERMAALIDDLLHLSRVSRADMNLRPVDLSAEATAVTAELRSSEPGRTVRIEIEDGVSVIADHILIRSVLQNLLENAWKFTARRDDAVIEFGTTHGKDNEVCYFVRDNGVGFDPAYASKLFKPFQRLHAANDFPGTGVGLASVKRIIERHGGHAWALGAVSRGATFYFTVGGMPPTTAPSRPAG